MPALARQMSIPYQLETAYSKRRSIELLMSLTTPRRPIPKKSAELALREIASAEAFPVQQATDSENMYLRQQRMGWPALAAARSKTAARLADAFDRHEVESRQDVEQSSSAAACQRAAAKIRQPQLQDVRILRSCELREQPPSQPIVDYPPEQAQRNYA